MASPARGVALHLPAAHDMNALPQVPEAPLSAHGLATPPNSPSDTPPATPPSPARPATRLIPPADLPVTPAGAARATCFLLPIGREQVPVWVFPPAHLQHAHAGLVLRAGARELLVFTRPDLDWGCGGLRLHVLDALSPPEMDAPPAPAPDGIGVRRLWRRTMSHSGDLQGLALQDLDSAMARRLHQHRPDPTAHRWVRCMIEVEPGPP